MLLKQHVDKKIVGCWSQHDVQLFTYCDKIYDSNLDVAFSLNSNYVKARNMFGSQNIHIYANNWRHLINNNTQQSWHKEVPEEEYTKSKSLAEQNYQKYYYCSNIYTTSVATQFTLYRIPKSLITLWNEGLNAQLQSIFMQLLIALKWRVPAEIAYIIIRATLELYKDDRDNYITR